MRLRTAIAAAAAMTIGVSGCASSDGDTGTVTITVSDGWSAKHPISTSATLPFLEYLREHGKSVGLRVEHYDVGQLGKQKDAPALLRSGAIDIAPVIPAYLANEIPLASVSELPGLVSDSCTGAAALMPMAREGGLLYRTQFSKLGVRPLWGILIPGYDVFTSDRKVTRPRDLQGALIRSPGGVGDRIVRGLGASPVQLAAPDLYEAVSRATVSGAILTQLSVTSYGLQDVLHYSTMGANLTTTTVFFAAGDGLWNRLDAAQRRVLTEASDLATAGGCKGMMKSNASATAKVRAAGVEMTEITPELRAEWDAALVPVREGWVRDLESVGLPAGQALAEFEAGLAGNNHG